MENDGHRATTSQPFHPSGNALLEAELEAAMNGLSIEVGVLREWLESGRAVTVLDVRPRHQREEWAIPGSLHVDAYDALWAGAHDALAGVELPAGPPVVTVCAEGKSSLLAALELRARGIEALSLAGGMKAWSGAWNSAEVPLPVTATRVVQMRRTGKGCLSYVVGSEGKAAVIDPSLDPDIYVQTASRLGCAITEVLDTHVHADHLSRGRALAGRCGATLRMPAQNRVAFGFAAVQDGDVVPLGAARLEALRVPGHTMESTCYLLDGRALFTGDTLFLDAVGRPDLEASAVHARERAHALYGSLRRLIALPAGILVLPCHTGTPIAFDGRTVAASLGEVRGRVAVLHASVGEFVEGILARIPPAPPNHQLIVKLNEAGVLPAGDLCEFEAGANRCAVA